MLGSVPQVWTPRPSLFLTLNEAKRKAEAIKANNFTDAHLPPKIAKIDSSLFPLFPDAKKKKQVAKTEAEDNTAVKIENFSNASHQSPLPVEQRTTIFGGEPVLYENSEAEENTVVKIEKFSNSGHQSSIPVEQYTTISSVEPVSCDMVALLNSTVDDVGNVEVDKKPEIVVVKSELDDERFTGLSCWQ